MSGRSAGRREAFVTGRGPIDVDVLLLGSLEYSSARLTLPHPEVLSRRFVLVPLLELDPELTLPDGRRAADGLAALAEGQECGGSAIPLTAVVRARVGPCSHETAAAEPPTA